jgi:hypothetical protein
MENNISTYVQLYMNDIELNISVKKDLTGYKDDEPLYQFGYIQITDGTIGDKPFFWDNLSYFINCGKKEFKEECKEELKEKGYDWKETYRDIKILLKRAKKLKLL